MHPQRQPLIPARLRPDSDDWGLYWGYIGILEKKNGNYYSIMGLYWDNGKENGNYCIIGLYTTTVLLLWPDGNVYTPSGTQSYSPLRMPRSRLKQFWSNPARAEALAAPL